VRGNSLGVPQNWLPPQGPFFGELPGFWGVTLQYQNIITSQAQEYFGVASSHISKGEKERERERKNKAYCPHLALTLPIQQV